MEDNRPGAIYALYHVDRPEIVEYLGQTVTKLEARRKGHIYDSLQRPKNTDIPIQNFIRKYGADSLGIREVEKCVGFEQLNKRETELIAYYRSIGQARLNVRDGGYSSPMAESSKDKLRKRFSGEGSPNTRLTWDIVRKARDMYVRGDSLEAISAFMYPLSVRQRDKILRNGQWVDPNYKVPDRRTTAILNMETARQIREEALSKHIPRAVLAEKYDISKVLVEKVLGNTHWIDINYNPKNLPALDYSFRKSGPAPKVRTEEVTDIQRRHDSTESLASIHKDYPHISYGTIRNVAYRRNAYRAIE